MLATSTGPASRSMAESARSDPKEPTVEDRFREMAACPPGSAEFRRCRDDIVRRCLPMADNVARRFNGRGESHEDLMQVARVGLVNAVYRYDVRCGSEFVSFAVPTMMGEVRRHFRDNSWSVKVPRRLKELHLRIGAATFELSQRLGRAPNASELAAELQMSREEVVEGLIASNSYSTISLDLPFGGSEGAPTVADSAGHIDASLERVENREALRPLLAVLPDRERTVLMLRFFESLTQTQIADRVGVSQVHVSRLLASSLARLRELVSDDDGLALPTSPRSDVSSAAR